MADSNSAFLTSDFNKLLRDYWTSKGCTKKILVLINCVSLNCWKNIIFKQRMLICRLKMSSFLIIPKKICVGKKIIAINLSMKLSAMLPKAAATLNF